MLRLNLPPRGSLAKTGVSDPLKYYYVPVLGRVFRARIDAGLALLDGTGPLGRLLEIGYGSGLLLPTLLGAADAVDGIDLDSEPSQVRESLARLGVTNVGDLVKGDARKMPFPDEQYDVACAFSILEHVPAPILVEVMAEVARVLKPRGRFLVGCPAVNKAMTVAFAAIGFSQVDDHHVSSIHDVLAAARTSGRFTVEKQATMPRGLPLGVAPYNVLLLRKS